MTEIANRPKARPTTLGQLSLTLVASDGTPRILLKPSKPLALVTYLALSPRHSASREHLINLLWADSDSERGLRTLRQTVWQMRQTLGDLAIVNQGRDLVLAMPMSSDRNDFRNAAAQNDVAAALAMYRGPFLPDFGVPGGAEFEHWADRERDRLHATYVHASESLIRSELDRGRIDIAVSEARRLRDAERTREPSWRLLLEALTASGDTLSSKTEADELERWLGEEEKEPERLTISAINRAKKSPPSTVVATKDRLVPELAGRELEFSRLTSAWTAVKRGEFRHVHLSAPAGHGKTRLLQDVIARLRAEGARIASIRILPGDRKIAYALASDVAIR